MHSEKDLHANKPSCKKVLEDCTQIALMVLFRRESTLWKDCEVKGPELVRVDVVLLINQTSFGRSCAITNATEAAFRWHTREASASTAHAHIKCPAGVGFP